MWPAVAVAASAQIIGSFPLHLFLIPRPWAEYCAVHACHGENASLNLMARAELERAGRNVRRAKGRLYFDMADGDEGESGERRVQALSEVRCVRSIRRVAACVEASGPPQVGMAHPAAQLAQIIDAAADWDGVVADLKALGIQIHSCCVVSRQFRQLARLISAEPAHHLHRELGLCLQRRLGWSPQGRGRRAASSDSLSLRVMRQIGSLPDLPHLPEPQET